MIDGGLSMSAAARKVAVTGLQDEIKAIARAVARDVHVAVVSETPVQTGATRSSWTVLPGLGRSAPSTAPFTGAATRGTNQLPVGSEPNAPAATAAAIGAAQPGLAQKAGVYLVSNGYAPDGANSALELDLGSRPGTGYDPRGLGMISAAVAKAMLLARRFGRVL